MDFIAKAGEQCGHFVGKASAGGFLQLMRKIGDGGGEPCIAAAALHQGTQVDGRPRGVSRMGRVRPWRPFDIPVGVEVSKRWRGRVAEYTSWPV